MDVLHHRLQRIRLLAEVKELKSENESLKSKAAQDALGDVMDRVEEVKGVKLLATALENVDMNGLRDLGDQLKEKLGEGVVVLASANEGKVSLVAMATDGAMKQGAHAGNLIKAVAAIVGGGGGGRPNMAQAGGKNPEKAQEILEAAGCTRNSDGFYERDGEEIGFFISVMSCEQDRIDIAQAAAQQLREVGIDCTVEIPAQMDWGGQMACLIGWGSPFDADDHTYKVFGTDKGANYSGYSNALVDEYLTLARQSSDDAVRKEYYSKFLHALADDPAYAFICYIDANYVAKSTVHGINMDTVLGHHGVGIFWNIQDWTIGE